MKNEILAEPAQPKILDASGREMDARQDAGLMQVIARAASNPAVDVDKMERLIAMQERLLQRQAEADFAQALAAMQPELPRIEQRGEVINHKTSKLQSRYAYWEDIHAEIMPVLNRNGFALNFVTDTASSVNVTAILSHTSGHKTQTTVTAPQDTSGNKNAVQAVGSSISYCKRYAAGALLNFVTVYEDDDAQKTGAPIQRDPDAPHITKENGRYKGLSGQHKTMSALQAAIRPIVHDLAAIVDEDQLQGFLDDNSETILQCKRDRPAWWHGKPDQPGLMQLISDARQRCREHAELNAIPGALKPFE